MKLLTVFLIALFLFGCAANRGQKSSIEFALSRPDHLGDWQKLQDEFLKADIACNEGVSSLGTFSCFISPDRFDHARSVASVAITRDSLSVRVRKESESDLFEVYEQGKKVNEESYMIEPAPNKGTQRTRN
jgi:hypothetical protein